MERFHFTKIPAPYEVRFVQWSDWNALSLTMNDDAREAALGLLGTTSHFTGRALVLNGNG